MASSASALASSSAVNSETNFSNAVFESLVSDVTYAVNRLDFLGARKLVLKASSPQSSLDKKAVAQARKIILEYNCKFSSSEDVAFPTLIPIFPKKDIKEEKRNPQLLQGLPHLAVSVPLNASKLPGNFGLTKLGRLKNAPSIALNINSKKSKEKTSRGSVKLPSINLKECKA